MLRPVPVAAKARQRRGLQRLHRRHPGQLPAQPGIVHQPQHGVSVIPRRVLAAVQPGVAGRQVRVRLPDQGHKPFPAARTQKQQVAGKKLRPVFRRRPHQRVYAGGAVGKAGQQRRRQHPRRHPVFHQILHRLQPRHRMGRSRFRLPPDLFVYAAYAEHHLDAGGFVEAAQHIHIPPRQRSFGGNGRRIAELRQDFQYLPRQAVLGLGRLVGVGGRADGNGLAAPFGAGQLLPQHGGRVHFGENLPLKIGAGVHPVKLVGRTGVAVPAGVAAAPVGVDRPAKMKIGGADPVDERLATDFGDFGGSHRVMSSATDVRFLCANITRTSVAVKPITTT